MGIDVTPFMAFIYVCAAFLFAANEYLKTSKKFKELSEETKQDYDNKKLAAEVEKLTNKIDASQFKVDVGYSKFLQKNPGRPFSDSSTESVTDYYLGSDEPIKEKKKVVAREWFFGIQETEDELKARYKKQEKAIAGWDEF